MSEPFSQQPVPNSPYASPRRHWDWDENPIYGRWAFAAFGDDWKLRAVFAAKVEDRFASLLETVTPTPALR
jgi:hypothetical protein